ncbi:MAG: glycosyltransferase family A protein [Singulisphaera sp.]
MPAAVHRVARRQTYRPLEIVVVVGPSADGTAGYASTLTDAKVCHVDRLNVSHAQRGVRQSGGEIIAFIDDDAVGTPDGRGVGRRLRGRGASRGGVGGYVINENAPGRPLQALNNTINDLGEPDQVRLAPAEFNDPDGEVFNYFMGATWPSAARRSSRPGDATRPIRTTSRTRTSPWRSSRPATASCTIRAPWSTTSPP